MTMTPTVTPSRTTMMLVSAAAFVIVVVGLKAANHIVAPVFLSVALVIVFYPLRARLERRMPVWVASVVVLTLAIVLLLVMALAIAVSIGQLAKLIPQYASELNGYVANVGDGLTDMGVGKDQSDAAVSSANVEKLVGSRDRCARRHLVRAVGPVLPRHAAPLPGLRLREGLEGLAEGARAHRALSWSTPSLVSRREPAPISASPPSSGLIVAVIDTAVLWALGIPGAFIWGVLAFVTNFIPNIGFVIGVIPPAIVGLLEGGPSLMLAVVVLYCVVNLVLQSFIQPRYVGDAVGLSTSLTFLSLVFWTWILGPVGALMAVPMSLLFRAILVEADPEGGWRLPLISGAPKSRRPREVSPARHLGPPFWTLVGLLVAYYAFPVEWTAATAPGRHAEHPGDGRRRRLVGTMMVGSWGPSVEETPAGARGLSMLLILLVMAASLTFFLLNKVSPEQVIGLQTRTDALYFTLGTMTTVGFGDVHAEGQVARAMVCALLVFNVVVVASLVRVNTRLGPQGRHG